jgi:hypothetical protein
MAIYRKQILHILSAFSTHLHDAALDCEAARDLEGWRRSIDVVEEFVKLGILYLVEWLVWGNDPPGQQVFELFLVPGFLSWDGKKKGSARK